MKRIAAAVVLLMVLGASWLSGGWWFGETELPGLDMSVQAPAGWQVLTREDAASETGAAVFGMTAEEAVKVMEESDFHLILYEPETGAEIYLTVFESQYAQQMRSMSLLSPEEMEFAKEDMEQGYPGWALNSEVTEKRLGEFIYLAATMHTDNDEIRMDNRQLFTVYKGKEIYIDLYAGADGLREEHVSAQDALAESLRGELALRKAKRTYRVTAVFLCGVLLTIFVQFVGVAMTVMLRAREKIG